MDNLLHCRRCGTSLLPELTTSESNVSFYNATVTSSGEVDVVTSELALLSADIDEVDDLICSLDSALAAAWQKRSELEDAHRRLNALLAPVRRMPVEVLAKIFSFCAPDYGVRPRRRPEALLSLGWVCSRWRDVVVATPQLWTTLWRSLDFPVSPSSKTCLNSSLLRHVWIPRSGNMPLSVALAIHDAQDLAQCENHQIVLRISERWRDASISIWDLDDNVFPAVLPLPNLQSLSLVLDKRISEGIDVIQSLSAALGQAGALTEVRLSNVRFAQLYLPWRQLRDLRFDNEPGWLPVTESAFVRCLERCPALEIYHSAHVGSVPDDHSLPGKHLCHANLQVLRIRFVDLQRGTVPSLFSHLTLPRLVALELFSEKGSRSLDALSLASFLERSACRLKSFALVGVEVQNASLIRLLSSMPTVQSLTLDSVFITSAETVWASLASHAGPSQKCILPSLQNISLGVPHEIIASRSLVAMISSRVPGNRDVNPTDGSVLHLRTFHLIFGNWADELLRARIEWERDGLEIV